MTKYQIKYEYQTGDSFGSSVYTSYIEYEWDDLELAKEALQRIREHYEWYILMEYYRYARHGIKKEPIKPEWHNVNVVDSHSHHQINIRATEDKEVQFWCNWCGYFERLLSAEIVTDESDMKIEF